MSKARGIYLNDLSSSLAIKTSLALCQTKYRFDWRRESLAVLRGTWQTSVLPEGTLLKWELFVLLLGVSAVPAQVPLLPLPEMLFLRLCSPGWRRDFKCAGIWFVLKGSFFLFYSQSSVISDSDNGVLSSCGHKCSYEFQETPVVVISQCK